MAHTKALDISSEGRTEIADAALPLPVADDPRSDEEWVAVIERRVRRAIAGEPGVDWADARKKLQRRFGSF